MTYPFFWGGRPHTIVLISGESALLINREQENTTLSLSHALRQIKQYKPCRFLLSAPYVYSMVQSTIILKRNELAAADRQMLSLSRFEEKDRTLESIIIDHQKAITVFSHLSGEGRELLTALNRLKIKPIWKPAISVFIRNLLDTPQVELEKADHLELILDQELIRFRWKSDMPVIKHCFFWNRGQDKSLSRQQALELVKEEKETTLLRYDLFDSQGLKKEITAFTDQLLFPRGKKKGLKSVKRRIGAGRLKRMKTISPAYILGFLTLCMLTWSIIQHHKLNQLKTARLKLHQKIEALNDQTDSLALLSAPERTLMKIEAMKESLEEHQLRPYLVLDRIEHLLPQTSWIASIKISHSQIKMELIDYQRIDSAKLVKVLSQEFGKIELGENSTIQLGDSQLKKYSITINQATSHDRTPNLDS